MSSAPVSPALECAAHLLAPHGCERFLSEWFERQPLHIGRKTPDHYASWVTYEAFTEAVTTLDPDFLRLLVARDDARTASVTWRRALDAYRAGATLVANQLHLQMPRLGRLCRGLEAFFFQPFQANAYLTPPGNQGFGAHFDVHDVFVLQIAGRKAWKVYSPTVTLPFSDQLQPVNVHGAAPFLEAVLEPGDLLYLPRGWIHDGRAVDGEPSLHISLGLLGLTWCDVLASSLRDLSHRDPRFRALYRMGPTSRPAAENLTTAADLVMSLLHEVQTNGFPLAEERFALARPAVTPRFPHPSGPVTSATRMQRDPLVVAVVRARGGDVELSFQGKSLPFPPEVREVLDFVLACKATFGVDDLPGPLDRVNCIRLLQYLCDEGLLRRTDEEGDLHAR